MARTGISERKSGHHSAWGTTEIVWLVKTNARKNLRAQSLSETGGETIPASAPRFAENLLNPQPIRSCPDAKKRTEESSTRNAQNGTREDQEQQEGICFFLAL